jgi:uncharacterized membrane protein
LRSSEPLLQRVAGPFVTGLVFLAPVLLTVVLLQLLAGYVLAALGPATFIGRTLAGGGMFVTADPGLAFLIGLGIAALLVWGLGLIVQTRARASLEAGLDRLLGRVPVIGGFYRSLAQVVRLVGNKSDNDMARMAVVAVRFGADIEVLGLLASPDAFDTGAGPRLLVLLPTAPVPVGGGLVFVDPARVQRVAALGVEDLAKFYVSMGTVAPDGLKAVAV